jgi:chemotaxis protein methyltransferase CheR
VSPFGSIQQIEPLSQVTFDRFRKLIYEKTSINMREGKHVLVSNRLRRRIVALKLAGYDEYYEYITRGPGRETEIQNFIDAVSTNETYFYRETAHFAALTGSVLPELFARRKRLRLWSAGCSTGEEPYTLRLVLDETLGAAASAAIEIVATDINEEVVEGARRGIYRERSVRFVPPAMLKRWFDQLADGSFQVKPELSKSIDFRVHALLKQPPPERNFDIIFCRNVMIYFDKPTQAHLVDDYFGSVLAPDGYLFIGHSESLTGTSHRFRFMRGLKAPIYQKLREDVKE